MQVHTLLTHEYPDLDGLVGCWLLRRFGKDQFPGVVDANLRFLPASFELDGLSADQHEADGALAVDIGGGRFDNHIRGKLTGDEADLQHSATSLIASELEVRTRAGTQNLVEFVRLQDIQGRSITTRNPEDHALALVSVLRGLHLQNGDDFALTFEQIQPVFDAIVAVEAGCQEVLDWYRKERPCRFELDGKSWMAANPFDAALVLWLVHHYDRPPIPPVSESELESGGTTSRILTQAWDLHEQPELAKLLSFVGLDRILSSSEYLSDLDFSVTALNVLHGMFLLHGSIEAAARGLFVVLDAMVAMEEDWFGALAEFRGCSTLVTAGSAKKRVRICAFQSARPSMARVARFKCHPDVSVHRDTQIGAVGITLMQYQGRLKDYMFDGRGGHPGDKIPPGEPRLDSLVARVRTAEALAMGEPIDIDRLNDVGMIHGWFLHQSLRIFAKGSRKARDVPPTKIPFDELVALIASTFDPRSKLPARWCPPGRCQAGECRFAHLELPNCRA